MAPRGWFGFASAVIVALAGSLQIAHTQALANGGIIALNDPSRIARLAVTINKSETIRFKQPFVPFVSYTATPFMGILAREIYDQDGHYKDRIVGSGPYQLDSAASQKGARWVWKKNPSYWDSGKPYDWSNLMPGHKGH